VQTAGTHGFNLGGIGLYREELDFLASGFGQMVQKLGPDLFIDRRIFHRGVGKYQLS